MDTDEVAGILHRRRQVGWAVRVAAGAALLALVGWAPSFAQPAHLVADIGDAQTLLLDQFPIFGNAVVMDGNAYWVQDDGVTGRELWRSDGTPDGTRRVKDICPGRCSSRIAHLTLADDLLFFGADDGAHGIEPWISDGTAEGTRMVADVLPGLASSFPDWITAVGERTFFTAREVAGKEGYELWTTDGTSGGTSKIADLMPGPEGSDPLGLVALDDRLLFFADDGVHGIEPWVVILPDLQVASLGDLHPGPADLVSPFQSTQRLGGVPVRFGDAAFFAADDGVHGPEPWTSDGTPGGTRMIADLEPGADGSRPDRFLAAGSLLFFSAAESTGGTELWATTEQAATAFRVADIVPGADGSVPVPLAARGSELCFSAFRPDIGSELWRTDGTELNTTLVRDIRPGPESGIDWVVGLWLGYTAGDTVFFAADDGVHGGEVWRSDGTEAGTYLLEDVAPGPDWSVVWPAGLSVATPQGDSFFWVSRDPAAGNEPWRSDGTPGGTERVLDIDQSTSSNPSILGYDLILPLDAAGRLVFGAWESATGLEPWSSRGTPGTTHLVRDIHPDPPAWAWWSPIGVLGQQAIVLGRDQDSPGLWATVPDATDAELLSRVSWALSESAVLGDRLFLTAEDDEGYEPWLTDGTPGGTGQLADLVAGPDSSFPTGYTVLGDRLFFAADTGGQGRELWSSDGTPGDTSPVGDLVPGPEGSDPIFPVVEGGRLFFGGTSPAEGRELWVSDGTEGGTGPVADIRPGPESGFVDPTGGPWYFTHPDHVAGQGRVFFIGDDGVHGEEPWTSDGTEAGTGALGDVRPGSLGSEPRWLTALGGDLYFTADDGVHGRELWRSGPAGPPALVADLVPGPGSSRPFDLLAVDGVLYYSAFTPETGVELWRTDGTAAGTGLVQDIHPGPESSTPEKLTVSGRRLYFTAHDGVHGFEPWALILPTRRPRATLTAQRVGPGTFDLTLTLFNPPPEELPDGDGDELALPLPAGLEPLAASATSGTVAVIAGGGAPLAAGRTTAAASLLHLVTWNGSLAAGASVVVTVRVRIDPEMPGPFSVQADGTYDSDGDGGSDESFTSDDPDLPGEANPTQLAAQVVEVPALSTACLALLILVLAIAGCHRLLSRS